MNTALDHPFLGRGFRPFFITGAAYAIVSMLLWVLHLQGSLTPERAIADPVLWHGHEMVFGFTMAIVAGFLLTAVANWTGGAPARQMHLAALCLIWLAGRLAMNLPGLPFLAAALIELAFIPALAISLAIPLLKSWNRRNFVFLFLLITLLACNIASLFFDSMRAVYLAILVIAAMISLIGGRIIPAFTVAALRRRGVELRNIDQPRMDVAALVSLLALAIALVALGPVHWATGSVALVSAAIHGWRIRRYHLRHVWHDPLLWSLHLGYIWLVLGLLLFGLAGLGLLGLSPALHALTAGSIGTMTLSMMCRVALGHTGRDLSLGTGATIALLLMQLAAITRVALPVLLPAYWLPTMAVSAACWAAAFGLYALIFAPILWAPRPDGRPA